MELLVVIGIIAVLIAILIPVVSNAWRAAQDVKCKSNLRQMGTALLNYAAENAGRFPPNFWRPATEEAAGFPSNWWTDADRIGRYIRPSRAVSAATDSSGGVVAPVLACPSDENASRSYAMNFWASSAIRVETRIEPAVLKKAAITWSANVKDGAKMILVLESVSHWSDGHGAFVSSPTVPSLGQCDPDERFYPGVCFIGTQYGWLISGLDGARYIPSQTQIDWGRHRRRGDGGTRNGENRGRANFGFADGHVASYTPDDLAHRTTQKSKFVALWSPLDYQVERLPRPF